MRAPWHLWVIGILSLLWNAVGAYDYVMTQTVNETYLAMLTEAQRAMLDSRPMWFDAVWALGVWGSVAGSLLILVRSRFAGSAFAISFVGLILAAIWQFVIVEPSALVVSGPFSLVFSGVIAVVILALFVYARRMTARGVLR
jgi:hypothetical protein